MRLRVATSVAALAICALPALSDTAQAGRRAYDDGTVITAFSRHGNGAIDGPVRRGRYAWEVMLPHGTWVSCRRSCEETLRVETIDIFENDGRMVGYGTLQNQCGVFGCLELNFPR
ncbi:MAG TPA: hypothetical protein PLD46_06900 [Hyphomicrobium sp.]|nr:hypothetical protein [Hyphomicrobium sp.]